MYKKIKRDEMPHKKRRSVSRLELTKEWQLMKADIDKGIKPNEALQICLSDDDKEKYRIKDRRAAARYIKKYLSAHKLPYAVKSMSRPGEGDFFIVHYSPVLKRTA